MMGNCHRCHEPGHRAMLCNEPRCLDCGEVGHESRQCRAPIRLRLTPEERRDVERQEVRFAKAREGAKEKKAKRQMGQHGTTIPEVKSSPPNNAPTEPKRKRVEDNEPLANLPKAPRTTTEAAKPTLSMAPASNGTGKPSMTPQAGMVKKKKVDPNAVFVKRR